MASESTIGQRVKSRYDVRRHVFTVATFPTASKRPHVVKAGR